MKKKLEADLISIAHRILQLKNKSDINQLYLETQKLYEKLAVLRFIDAHYGDVKPTIGHAEIEKEIQAFYDKSAHLPIETIIEMTENQVSEIEIATSTPIVDSATVQNNDTVTIETTIDEAPFSELAEELALEDIAPDIEHLDSTHENETLSVDDVDDPLIVSSGKEEKIEFKAAFELTQEPEAIISEPANKIETIQISFEDLLGVNYSDTLFVKVDEIEALPPTIVFENPSDVEAQNIIPVFEKKTDSTETKTMSLNDKLSKGIDIDLNDRIAFVKHLFANSTEDYNRVLNQLITFDTFKETITFIDEMVKPDYNNWKGKDDYADRFMDIIEKKFL